MRQLSSRSDECRANLADYHLKWVARVVLRPLGAFYSVHEDDLAAVPISGHGVYVFCRQYGRTNSPLYIGRSKRLRQRIREHLERVSLVSALAAGEPGRRIVLVARVEPRPGQCAGRVAQEVESLLIRRFREDGFDLINERGAKRPARMVRWTGSNAYLDLIPRQMVL